MVGWLGGWVSERVGGRVGRWVDGWASGWASGCVGGCERAGVMPEWKAVGVAPHRPPRMQNSSNTSTVWREPRSHIVESI